MTLLLALALLGQTRDDLTFTRATEDFVMEVVADGSRPWLRMPALSYRRMSSPVSFGRSVSARDVHPVPPVYRRLFAGMAGASYGDRQAASIEAEKLVRAEPGDMRWLWWGRRDIDPEVRLRCNTLVRRLNPCPDCKGSGVSRNWPQWPCWSCEGSATVWPRSMWD